MNKQLSVVQKRYELGSGSPGTAPEHRQSLSDSGAWPLFQDLYGKRFLQGVFLWEASGACTMFVVRIRAAKYQACLRINAAV